MNYLLSVCLLLVLSSNAFATKMKLDSVLKNQELEAQEQALDEAALIQEQEEKQKLLQEIDKYKKQLAEYDEQLAGFKKRSEEEKAKVKIIKSLKNTVKVKTALNCEGLLEQLKANQTKKIESLSEKYLQENFSRKERRAISLLNEIDLFSHWDMVPANTPQTLEIDGHLFKKTVSFTKLESEFNTPEFILNNIRYNVIDPEVIGQKAYSLRTNALEPEVKTDLVKKQKLRTLVKKQKLRTLVKNLSFSAKVKKRALITILGLTTLVVPAYAIYHHYELKAQQEQADFDALTPKQLQPLVLETASQAEEAVGYSNRKAIIKPFLEKYSTKLSVEQVVELAPQTRWSLESAEGLLYQKYILENAERLNANEVEHILKNSYGCFVGPCDQFSSYYIDHVRRNALIETYLNNHTGPIKSTDLNNILKHYTGLKNYQQPPTGGADQ